MTTHIARRLVAHRIIKDNGCWESSYCRNNGGYTQIKVDRKTRLCHRVAYELWVGPVPEGLELDHLCRNRGCWNPEHLEPVTRSENTFRGNPAKKASSGVRGVCWSKQKKRWEAYLSNTHLGCFYSKEDAINARNQAMEARDLCL